MDSQSVRASGRGGLHGYDGGKRAGGITVEVVQCRDGVFRSTWARVGEPPPAVPLFAVVPRCWVAERAIAGLYEFKLSSLSV